MFWLRVNSVTKRLQPVVLVAVVLQCLHIGLLLFLPHPLVGSHVVQVVLPAVVTLGCLRKWQAASELAERRAWLLLTIAFALWSAAEVCYLLETNSSLQGGIVSSIDDLLWLLFAVPLLLVVSGSLESELNWISWMDQAQPLLLFIILAVLVYSRPSILSFNKAYSAQNLALLLSCTFRYSRTAPHRERRFFRKLWIYLFFYTVATACGSFLAHRGWNDGTLLDLFWTVPLTIFFVAMNDYSPETARTCDAELPVRTGINDYLHDLSALGLAALSIFSSVYLALHRTLPGCVCLTLSLLLFALRTCGREGELRRANRLLQESILKDGLTGAGNRNALRYHLERLLNRRRDKAGMQHGLAVLFIDLDHFKAINDNLGHEVGDAVLVEAARRISDACSGLGIVCRLGGDEFVVLLQDEMARNAQRFAVAILEAIRKPLQLEARTLEFSGTIGVALSKGAEKPDTVLRLADDAMYRAKKLGKNRIEVLCDVPIQAAVFAA